jgi:hypothetical protein
MNYLLFIQISFYIFTRSSIVFLGGTIFYQYLVSLFIDAENSLLIKKYPASEGPPPGSWANLP